MQPSPSKGTTTAFIPKLAIYFIAPSTVTSTKSTWSIDLSGMLRPSACLLVTLEVVTAVICKPSSLIRRPISSTKYGRQLSLFQVRQPHTIFDELSSLNSFSRFSTYIPPNRATSIIMNKLQICQTVRKTRTFYFGLLILFNHIRGRSRKSSIKETVFRMELANFFI